MEEILASIRRILNDDETSPTAPAAGNEPAADEEVLILDQSMMVAADEPAGEGAATEAVLPEATMPVFHAAEPEPEPPLAGIEPGPAHTDPALKTPAPDPVMEAVATPGHADRPDAPAMTPDLVAPETAAAAASAVGNLVRTLAAGRATQVYGGGPTLEDMVRAELRPLLKEWLDTNLPVMVERLVRLEIEKVVARGVP